MFLLTFLFKGPYSFYFSKYNILIPTIKSPFLAGDHKSKAVINVLLDLLYDENQDVRVVAAISLAHAASEIKKPKTRSEVMNG